MLEKSFIDSASLDEVSKTLTLGFNEACFNIFAKIWAFWHLFPTIILEEPELYDLRADISEKYDVAKTFPNEVSKMLKTMESHLKDVEGSRPEQLSHVIEGSTSTDGFRYKGRGF